MDLKLAMKIILGFSVAGVLFSGYLTYSAIVNQVCPIGGQCIYIGMLPSCFYGFLVFCAMLGISGYALATNKKR